MAKKKSQKIETQGDSEPQAHRKMVRCPACGKSVVYSSENQYRPFCSERCKINDLGDWASEKFRIPTADNLLTDHDNSDDDEKMN